MEESAAASVAAEPIAAPVETSEPAVIDRASEPTPKDAIERAFAKVDQMDGDRADAGRARNPDGTFAPKPQDAAPEPAKPLEATPEAPKDEPPARFNAEAKAAWATLTPAVKAEVKRAVTEMETGLREYQERWEPLKQYDQLAQQHGSSIQQALQNYVGLAEQLKRDPLAALDHMAQFARLGGLREVAAHIMGQTPDQAAQQSNNEIRQLRQHIAQLEQMVGGVATTFQQQQENEVKNHVLDFAQKQPRFDELAGDIAFFISSGKAHDLSEAYTLAERLNPASAPAAPAAPTPDPAHTRGKGNLSVTGAPSSGSNPVNRKPPSSARESIDRAFGSLGLN